ncbi:unnamed protein product [Cochlearia groenlandica]
MNYLIIFMLVTTMCFEINQAVICHGRPRKNHVVIQNEIDPGMVLDIQCRRKNRKNPPTKYGRLNFKDPNYTIEFEDDYPYDEAWYCILSYGTNPKYWYDIEVYRQGFRPKCNQLRLWVAKKDGIWFTRNYRSPPGHVLDWKIM